MSFRTIVGHRRLRTLLSRAVARDTLPPSLLLAGPAGVGKRRLARALAQVINCLQPWTPARHQSLAETGLERDACGECPSCRRIARGIHPDVLVIEPDDGGKIKIEQVRDVIDRAGYRPFEARRRVAIFDEADAMMPPAQSALLKTLEEPPAASIFLLVSSLPDALLPTVRSRCPRLRFGVLTPAEIAEALRRDHGYTDRDAHAAAADADGSLGRALAARSVDLAEARTSAQRLLEQTARLEDPSRRMAVARELSPKKGTSADEREQLASCLRATGSLLRDLELLATRADARWVANADLGAELRRLSASYDSGRALRAFAAVDRALAALERNASPKIVADWLVLQL